MTMIYEWARAWGIPADALVDLQRRAGQLPEARPGAEGSEAGVQQRRRMAAAAAGDSLFRNNVGAYRDKSGGQVRYGLCNDSPKVNARLKSGDLIGWTRTTITPQLVGATLAVFTSEECKRPGWTWRGDEHELAQMRWAELVIAAGGIARFVNA